MASAAASSGSWNRSVRAASETPMRWRLAMSGGKTRVNSAGSRLAGGSPWASGRPPSTADEAASAAQATGARRMRGCQRGEACSSQRATPKDASPPARSPAMGWANSASMASSSRSAWSTASALRAISWRSSGGCAAKLSFVSARASWRRESVARRCRSSLSTSRSRRAASAPRSVTSEECHRSSSADGLERGRKRRRRARSACGSMRTQKLPRSASVYASGRACANRSRLSPISRIRPAAARRAVAAARGRR